mgnify:CR=1 FL=1
MTFQLKTLCLSPSLFCNPKPSCCATTQYVDYLLPWIVPQYILAFSITNVILH